MGKVNVVIVDATGNKEQKVGLPDDIKPSDNGSSAKLSTKAVAGIAVGGVCGLIAIALVVYVLTRQKSNRFKD